jgi:hypothetical protein
VVKEEKASLALAALTAFLLLSIFLSVSLVITGVAALIGDYRGHSLFI